MKTIKIRSSEPVTFFRPNSGGEMFAILPGQINQTVDAPAWISETLLFKMLHERGVISYASDVLVGRPEMGQEAASLPDAVNGQAVTENRAEPVVTAEIEVSAPKKRTRRKKGDAE